MAVGPETPIELIQGVYATLDERVGGLRTRLGRPLTLAEKILANHLDQADAEVERAVSYVDFRPDRVAMQDATAQMAWLQFDTAGLKTVTLKVENMTCSACPLTVRKALEKVSGVAKAKIDFETKTATVVFDPAKTGVEALTRATTEAGYPSALVR